MKKVVLGCLSLVLSLAFCPLVSFAQSPATQPAKLDLSKFTMTFNDEFDGEHLDITKWEAPEMIRQGSSRWVKSQVWVQDGNLHLGARRREDDNVIRYDCGAVRTQRNYDAKQSMFMQCYGYYETRCKMPKVLTADYWAAFWLLSGNVGLPDTRGGVEVDIFESFHLAQKDAMNLSFHWNGYGKLHNVAGVEGKPTPQIKDGQFHTYGLYWDEKIYALFIDGVEVCRTDLIGLGKDDNGKTKSQGPCTRPAYVKLTLEAADWPGATNGWEKVQPLEDEMVVDYVRVYTGKLPDSEVKDTAEKK